jgi:RNA polymerase sigma-70 factor, ECF subfamily
MSTLSSRHPARRVLRIVGSDGFSLNRAAFETKPGFFRHLSGSAITWSGETTQTAVSAVRDFCGSAPLYRVATHLVPPTAADLFERHHLAIYRYLLRMTGSREVAEDLTQEVFVRVVRSSERYEERERERAWLFRIARNLRTDHLRHERRTPASDTLWGVDVAGAAMQGLRLSLSQALDDLEANDREVFVLAEISGLSYAEIAAVCVTTPAAVRSRIYRARQALRAALAGSAPQSPMLVRGHHE